jgi:hypothetical protein
MSQLLIKIFAIGTKKFVLKSISMEETIAQNI